MDRDEFMELVYETFAEEPDNVLANGIIEAADAYVEHEKAQLSKEDTTSDLISRRAVLDAIVQCTNCGDEDTLREYVLKHSLDNGWTGGILEALDAVKDLPPAQPEPTDINAKEAVYNLAEKIGIHQLFALTVELRGEPIQSEPQWIPVSERMPEESGWYICTCHDGVSERVTFLKWQKRLKQWEKTGTRSYWKVIAWMPLPEAYKPNK